MIAYFVSDIHIKDESEPSARAFISFARDLLERRQIGAAGAPTHLFLVGDIFDLWVGGHEYFRNRFESIVDVLRSLVRAGVKVHYFEGNHDLHLHDFWQTEIGVEVHEDEEYFELGRYAVRVEHGDRINPDDRGYLFLRWLLRTAPMKNLACGLPSKIVAAIGARASRASRGYTSATGAKAMASDRVIELIREHARLCYLEKPFDLMIAGHVHIRDDFTFETSTGSARSVNLGSWFDGARAFLLSNERAEFIELGPGELGR